MKIFYYYIWCYIWIISALAKSRNVKKQSNVIATFSEDEISTELPDPKEVASSIPSNLILKKFEKSKVFGNKQRNILNASDKKAAEQKSQHVITGKAQNEVTEQAKIQKTNNKNKLRATNDESQFINRKSKSMNDRDEYEYLPDPYINFSEKPSTSQVSAQFTTFVTITASPISNLPTKISDSKEKEFQLAQAISSSIYSITNVPTITQRNRKFTQISRMNMKRAESSTDQCMLTVNTKSLLFILFLSIVINQIQH